ncbi:MAG: methionine--tRNA ligase [Candidatus Nealsonbacteria bacterium CG_4_9_14_0_2_um_filter_37_38]|uniref:Methionine--tRNA ligase n=1 Tax=Candidatus Nealsonbacteria bacterium CG_4_10_14_0_8_um_filter_37_14 TaxID=1974684 RepID=A0A2M7R6X9_9BACT|nr:MAG: methionine--tRNA ligase [Candidatus Nealsonbacteria bacterium CG11_big_fil_rev_8_21_14_0_20_37_68]PIY89164.1 MAG: methionine--tRNA ligase [Candidatus Nealsonbacteria bacterium CG_4_10_14_0_8_um_filter_37_14]PJC51705.1 MAG: methionine--tRNA ligase [Candidatus Nealsonbacteria bacterium CG_4_9_14_0_2_um_filter_37_38]
MAKKNKKFYLSTALPYVNESPHAGWALEIIQTDVIARRHRLLGEDVFFLTGTDENSLKNVRAAEEEGLNVKELVDRNAKKFYELKKALNLSFDDFIRTTEKRHIKGAQKLWLVCKKDIYKKTYGGLYCVGCEEFYKESELKNGLCPEHQTKPELVEEENYFFRLFKYQNQLKKIIKEDRVKIIPETRKNEILSFLNSGLEDICISRSAERGRGWGIPVPGDPTQVQWTWFDALSNYINALGYGENDKNFQDWWQKNENKLHIIGKGILRFHAIYWLAILLSAKLAIPKTIFVHGYLTSGGQKMSKSLGNIIDPFELVKKYGTDTVRYFLLREIPSTEDGDFTYEKFEARYNSDLASGLGNLVARVMTVAENLKSQIPNLKSTYQNSTFKKEIDNTWKKYEKALDEFKFNEALISVWDLISFCDRYIEKERPWEKSKKQSLIIYNLLVTLADIALMLQPFLPESSDKIFDQLGIKPTEKIREFKIKKGKPLFPRI